MNALIVQHTHQKCDLGNKNDSVNDKKITADIIFDCNNNYYNYYTEILYVYAIQLTMQALLV